MFNTTSRKSLAIIERKNRMLKKSNYGTGNEKLKDDKKPQKGRKK
jgi:hypothetical protein